MEWSEPYSPITYGVAPTYIKSGHKFDVTYTSHEIEVSALSHLTNGGEWVDNRGNPSWYSHMKYRYRLRTPEEDLDEWVDLIKTLHHVGKYDDVEAARFLRDTFKVLPPS